MICGGFIGEFVVSHACKIDKMLYSSFVIFLCKTEADFLLWCKQIVPDALADRKAFRRGDLNPHEKRERYDEVLTVNRQLKSMKYLLSPQHIDFFDRCLIGNEPYARTAVEAELYREIYAVWCKACFPEGLLSERIVNNVALGQRLKALRLKKGLGVNRTCALLGIATKTFYKYEDGTRQIKLDTLYKMSRLYGFKIDELLAEKGIVDRENVSR